MLFRRDGKLESLCRKYHRDKVRSYKREKIDCISSYIPRTAVIILIDVQTCIYYQFFQSRNKQAEKQLLPRTTERRWTELRVFVKKLPQTTKLEKNRLQIRRANAAFQLWGHSVVKRTEEHHSKKGSSEFNFGAISILTILTVWFPLLMAFSTARLPSQMFLYVRSAWNKIRKMETHISIYCSDRPHISLIYKTYTVCDKL